MLESEIEGAVKTWADEHGVLNAKLTPMGQRGYPDRVFFVPGGRLLVVEFKKKGEKPGKLQEYVIGKLRANGYDARWTDDGKTAIGWLRAALDAAQGAAKSRKARP
jgi:hypothetical protein